MSKFNIVVQSNFSPKYETNPVLPGTLNIDIDSLNQLKKAPMGVAFTGIVNLQQNKIYLNPLVPTRAGNEAIGELDASFVHPSAGIIEARDRPSAILHPNLTPQLRAQQGLTSGHTQICEKLKFREDDCIGFSLNKGEVTKMGITSRTLNSEKFQVEPLHIASEKLRNKLKAQGMLKPRYGEGGLTKEWAFLIAATLEKYSMLNCQGIQTAPF